jgi:hypothetical protein
VWRVRVSSVVKETGPYGLGGGGVSCVVCEVETWGEMVVVAYPSPWLWRLRTAAEATEAVRRVVVVVVNFMIAPAQVLIEVLVG